MEQAVALAAELACPAVLKLYSQTITHKTDVGGVKTDVASTKASLEETKAQLQRTIAGMWRGGAAGA